MKTLLLGIIAILFSFNGWAEEINFECCIHKASMGKIRPCPSEFHLSVNTETGKGSVVGDISYPPSYISKADVTFTKDQATWKFIHPYGNWDDWTINRESLKVDWPDGEGDWGQCEIVKDNPKRQF